MKFAIAKTIGAVSTWGLKHVFHRPAGNFPGKMALYVDPQLIAHLRSRISVGSIVVVGTNGKTSTTNLLADALEAAGSTVMCNRGGANLDSGVATTMLQSPQVQWGVFETDELWMAKILPQLQAKYVLLLNLFRDQLDRVGEVDRIQESIAESLRQSPDTVLVYNADDPLCQAIADAVSNETVAFGMAELMGSDANENADAQMCQTCGGVLDYAYRQYDHLGEYTCSTCGFSRGRLDFAGSGVRMAADGMTFQAEASFKIDVGVAPASGFSHAVQLRTAQSSPYVAYNLLAAYAVATLAGCPAAALQQAIDAFNPRNGRLQRYRIAQRNVLLNLAKNPTGFNQNLGIVQQDEGPKAVAFFVNDKEGDGRDVSWLWDVDFEALAQRRNCVVFAGGMRKNDVQVRLKYAGVQAVLVEGANEMFSLMNQGIAMADGQPLPAGANAYLIANYTALPPVHAELDAMEGQRGDTASQCDVAGSQYTVAENRYVVSEGSRVTPANQHDAAASCEAPDFAAPASRSPRNEEPPALVIAHMYPELLNLNGDGGNVRVLQQRLAWRGIPVEVRRVHKGDAVLLDGVDLVFLGSGPDREQRAAFDELAGMRDSLRSFAHEGGVVLAVNGGFQMLGKTWLLGDQTLEGLGVLNLETKRTASYSAASACRVTGNVVASSPVAQVPVVGYENHAGSTHLGEGVQPFGQITSSSGSGNNDGSKADGALCGTVLGTYLHGPLLAKNPEVADWLLARALERWASRTAQTAPELTELTDAEERAANDYAVRQFA